MHREKLLNLLNFYVPSDELEKEYKTEMMRFLKENENCFERSNMKGHFTGSGWLENHDGSSFLLTKHKKLGMWLQLGGHADGDNDLVNVSVKEAQEESGIKNISTISEDIFDLSVHLIPEHKDIPAHYHYDVRFLLRANEDDAFIISEESTDLNWFSDSIPSDNQELLRMFYKWKSRAS